MRHLRQVGNNRRPADILTKAHIQFAGILFEIARCQNFVQMYGFAARVWQFDTDDIAPRYHRDTGGNRAHGTRDIIGQADHA